MSCQIHVTENSNGSVEEIANGSVEEIANGSVEEETYVPLKKHPGYSILNDFPHTIRKEAANGKPEKVVTVNHSQVYPRVKLNGEYQYLHRVIAQQLVHNADPVNKTQVDHIDRNKENCDKHNLRWVSASENLSNRAPYRQRAGFFIEDSPVEAPGVAPVGSYKSVQYDRYWWNFNTNRLIFLTRGRYKVVYDPAVEDLGRVTLTATDGSTHTVGMVSFRAEMERRVE